jgi:hypothetical protein
MTDHPDRPGYSFNPGAPPEVTRYLQNKGFKVGFSWLDTEPEEHAVSFTVAKAMQVDLLGDIQAELLRANAEGLPFRAFAKSLTPKLQARGWWGQALMEDPATGALEKVQLGSPRRLKTIYDANIRTARAAGQWERIERTKALLPFLEYRLGPSEDHRPHHEDKAGVILPVDHPFWDEWMPPNGWGCKCWVKQITRRAADAKGGVSADPVVPDRTWTNKRTGETQLVPQGIDPGWQRNPGQLRLQAQEALLRGKIDVLPEPVARTALRDILSSWRLERMMSGESPGSIPMAVLSPALRDALKIDFGVVSLRDDIAAKIRVNHPDVTIAVMAQFADAIYDGTALLRQFDGRTELHILVAGEKPWRMVIKLIADKRELWISSVHRIRDGQWDVIKQRRGMKVVRE